MAEGENGEGEREMNEYRILTCVDIASGDYRCEPLQPDEQTPDMRGLFKVGLAVQAALTASVPVKVEGQ